MSAICFFLTKSNWVMVDSSFGQGFTNNSWILSLKCDNFEFTKDKDENNTCLSNSIKYVRLKKDNARMDKIILQKSFQSQVIVDIFFDDRNSATDKMAYFTLNYTVESGGYITQNARKICNNTELGNFDLLTYIGTSPILYKEKYNISIGIESQDDLQLLGVRNLFVYVKYCQPTCLSCNDPSICLTCSSGSLNNGLCICDPEHQFAQAGIGCRQECERDYFIARSDNVCVPDRRIKSLSQYFTSTFTTYSPFQFDPDSNNVRSSPTLTITHCSTKYVGNLLYNEGMSLSLENQQNIRFIRLRVTFYTQGFLTNSGIQIILDDQIQGEIIKSSSTFDFNQIKKIYSSSTICPTYEIARIEAILRTYQSTPKLIFKGRQLSSTAEIWGFTNVTIDSGNCKENCQVCQDFSTCSQCQPTYVLFQGECISNSCPVHSSNCIDYADMIPNSRYLAKGFIILI
ncbi:unnamed protein product [Paramecium sonneborni]|uniref:Uncharacterized protein n=1 Tax=Paramecium sonneborni TaxID=65129 RepID=A0A8S1QPR6_9CILI|nr:unnamed protein product [Paramecium sonneborni]